MLDIHKYALMHVIKCDDCLKVMTELVKTEMARHAGQGTSKAKAKSSRLNGRKGGRPRKNG